MVLTSLGNPSDLLLALVEQEKLESGWNVIST